jgi:hypothetical protein
MGFSIQLALVGGRLDAARLARWVHAARPRRAMRGPVLTAEAWGEVTVLYFNVSKKVATPVEAPSFPLPPLPAVSSEARGGETDVFVLGLAELAHAEGLPALYVMDSSISECGHVIVPGRDGVSWTADTQELGRERAAQLIREVLGEGAPELADLQWGGGGESYWERQIPKPSHA